jgi:hypothetical protein
MEKQKLTDRWKATAEELRLQLHLGSKELSQKFETQKKEILHWSRKAQEDLEDEASQKGQELKTKLEELEVQAALGKAESRDALKNQEEKISKLLHEIGAKSDEFMETSKEKAKSFNEASELQFQKWQTSFDMFRLQMKLGAAETKDQWEEKRKEIKSSLDKLEAKIDEMKEDGEENFSNFKNEMSKSWSHFKNAFKKG